MKVTPFIVGALASVASIAAVAPAQAAKFSYEQTGGAGGPLAGSFESLQTTYNTNTDKLTWSSTFNTEVDGAWLVINGGGNPKQNSAGELAIFYLDGLTNKLTAYEYNGQNNSKSYNVSQFLQAWENAVDVDDSNGERTLSFEIDATEINDASNFGFDTNEWAGAQFGDEVGIWFHAVDNLTTAYDANWALTQFTYDTQLWVDNSRKQAVKTPEPTALGALGLLSLGLVGRLAQRKKQA